MSNSNSKSNSNSTSSNNNAKKPSKQSPTAIGKGNGKAGGAMIKCKTFVFKPTGNGIVNFAYNLMLDEEIIKEAGEAFGEREGGRERENGYEKENSSDGGSGLVIVDRKQTQTQTTTSQTTSTSTSKGVSASISVSASDLDFKAFVERKSNLESISEEETSSLLLPLPALPVKHKLKISQDKEGKKVYDFAPGVMFKTYRDPSGKLVIEESAPGTLDYIRNLDDFTVQLFNEEEGEGEKKKVPCSLSEFLTPKEKKVKVAVLRAEAEEENEEEEEDEKAPAVIGEPVDFNRYKRVRRS